MDNTKNILRSATDFALYTARSFISPGDVLVDATCGNGRDTVFLASCHPSKLYAFDLQPEAIASTRKLLSASGYEDMLRSGFIVLINDTHCRIPHHVPERPGVIMFNLGYLPGGSRDITTKADSTLEAVKGCLSILRPDGLISVTMYSGHEQGAEERDVLIDFACSLDPSRYHVSAVSMINQRRHPPENLFITLKP